MRLDAAEAEIDRTAMALGPTPSRGLGPESPAALRELRCSE